ncbi:MAG TPA: hypothetical protein VF950_27655 [Planctomycetota bacterium]
MAELTPDGVDDLEALGPGVWRGRRDGRPVIVRSIPSGDARAAEALRRIEHPALPRLLDAQARDGSAWAVFERVEGETLLDRLDRLGALPWTEAVDVLRRAAGALDALSRAGLRHGALRPSNIVFDDRGGATFVDAVWGRPTPETYLAPEGRSDVRADFYALGLTLHEMLVGLPAYVARDPRELRALHARGGLRFDLDVPPALAEAGRRLTDPDPERRLANGEELLRLLDGLGAPPRRRVPALTLLALIALVVGGAVWTLRRDAPAAPAVVVDVPSVVVAKVPARPEPPPPPPPPPPIPAPPKPPPGPSPEEVAAEIARAEGFEATADALAAARDYARLDAEAPALRAPEARARLDAVLAPHRRAARAWAAALAQLGAMKGRVLQFTLRDGSRPYGKVEEVEASQFQLGEKVIPLKDVDTASIARLAMGGRGAATDLEVLAFALFEGDAATAKLAAEDVEPDPWAAPRLAALLKAAEEKAAREKRERAAELALRAADRAWKDYRPDMYADVADLHPDTAAGTAAREKHAAARKSLARWAFNDGQAAGWIGAPVSGGRWGGKGYYLRAEAKAERSGVAPLFMWSPAARLRFDYRAGPRARLTVTIEGEGGTSTAEIDETRSSTWQAFDRPLSDFKGGAFAEGQAVKVLRVEARAESGAPALSLDSIELYTAP